MKYLQILICVITGILPFSNAAQTIPQNMVVNWGDAGLQQFHVDTGNVANVLSFGATGNGSTNDLPAVLSAISSLGGQSGIVYFPPGNYRLNGTIYLPDSVILKGASADQSALIFNLNNATGNCINVWQSQNTSFTPVRGGYTKDSGYLLCDSAHWFTAGSYAELRQENGSWDTQPQFWAQHAVGQMLRVTSVSADTIFLLHPIRIDYDSVLNVEIRPINPLVNAGIECLRITRTDSTAASVNYGIYLNYAAHCRIRGVEMHHTIGAMIWAEHSTAIEISGCYFHEAYNYSGSSTKGYGVVMAQHAGEARIENNIFRKLRHAMMVKQGANGNVFAYNYSIEPTRTEFPTDFGGDISLHGHYPFANLFEGNICQNLMVDQAYGPSGPFNTFFRNRIELYGIVVTAGTVNTNYNSFVGNDITGTGPFQGNYSLSGTGHFEHGNNDNGVIKPTGTGTLPDVSYYLSGIPPFWNIGQSFPNIGTPNPVSGQNIPAKSRYASGTQLTICNPDTFTTGISIENLTSMNDYLVFPNPTSEKLHFKLSDYEITAIRIYNFQGRMISDLNITEDFKSIDVSGLNPGVYFLVVFEEGKIVSMPFVRQ
jgi:hypothetical protein